MLRRRVCRPFAERASCREREKGGLIVFIAVMRGQCRIPGRAIQLAPGFFHRVQMPVEWSRSG
jgi:hypothetical protein